MPRGFFASGFFAASTSSGTITVRAQYDIFDRWIGNQRGKRISSTGTVGTFFHEVWPYSANRMRVKTLALSAPPRLRTASRACFMCGALGSSPIIFNAK
jgi:hypothetical protein